MGLIAVRDAVVQALGGLDDQLMAKYSVTPFFVIYLVRQALMLDAIGKEFCQDPGRFVTEAGFDAVRTAVLAVAEDLIVDLNAELVEREEVSKPIDHKRELKSANAVRALSSQIIPGYQKALKRSRASSFSEEWEAVKKSNTDSEG